MIETFFTLTKTEYLESQNLYLSQKAKRSKKWRLLLTAIMFIGLFVFLCTTTNLRYALIFTMAAVIGSVGLVFFVKYVFQARILRQRFKTELRMLSDVYLRLDDSGIYSQTKGIGESTVEWNAYSSWLEGTTVFVLLVGYLFKPIPKRTLSEENQKELRDLLTRKIGSIGVVRKP